MPSSLLDAATREGFVTRIRALRPDARPRFETLTLGPPDARGWAALIARLLDHHLSQFGV